MQQILIIGLGQFGTSLARTLTEKGAEVLAVDRRKDLVEKAANYVTQAIALDATDEESLSRLKPDQRDACVCAIGDEGKEAAIICTALLRQMGASQVVSRAGDEVQRRILLLVGAHQVVNPEQDFGRRFANQLAFQNIVSDMPLSDDLHITELEVPASFVGKSLSELHLPRRFGVMIVAIRRGTPARLVPPTANDPLLEHDRLIVVSPEEAIHRMIGEA